MTRMTVKKLLIPILVLTACGMPGTSRRDALPDAALSPVEAMRDADTAGYAKADRPRDFVFPQDHGPHPEFQLEWWYFVGHLESESGRRFGYQLTFFRQALAPEPPPETPSRASDWAARHLYMAHFALTDVAGRQFHSFERFSRAAAGLAGARAEPFAVWIDDWSVRAVEVDGDLFPARLVARAGDVALELELDSSRPLVLQGEDGLSRKGPEPGDASYYYSFTRLETRGTVELADSRLAVDGSGWLDREFSTSVLGAEQVGWDWLALQLDDGRDLMFFHLRRRDGSVEPFSHGTLVEPGGESRPLLVEDVELEVERTWTSPRGTLYPAGWRLAIPAVGLELEIEPWLADQELDVSFRYWEGAVGVRGRQSPAPGTENAAKRLVTGRGYVELVGYGD